MPGAEIPERFATLSDDARAVAGGPFGLMVPGEGTLVFRTPSRVTARAKDALVELVEAGVCTHVVGPDGSWTYQPMVDCACFVRWMGRNKGAGRFPLVND